MESPCRQHSHGPSRDVRAQAEQDSHCMTAARQHQMIEELRKVEQNRTIRAGLPAISNPLKLKQSCKESLCSVSSSQSERAS